MTDVIITTAGAYIKAVPGISAKDIIIAYRTLRSMESVLVCSGSKGTYVEVRFSDNSHWTLDVNKIRGYDATLNGVTPNSNEDLAAALALLLVGV